jgi:YggT family protein
MDYHGVNEDYPMPFVVFIAVKGIDLLMLVILVTSLLSWIRPDPRNPIVRFLHGIVDPVLHPIRLVVPAMGGMDFSPLIAILILSLLQKLVLSAIIQ